MLEPLSAHVGSLYVHVPFCAHKCEYCAFYSEAAAGELVNRYVAALVRELEMVAPELKPKTIFFGGGTPSLLNLRQWETLLRAMEKLNLLGAEEFTIESNPATVSADKCKLLRDFGVNRISMGVQSLDEMLLDRLGRIHSREMVFKSFDTLRKAGFENVNLDLMFAIPTQTMATWHTTLNEAMAMQSEHLSSYEVIYEDDTPLFDQLKAGEFSVDEELAGAMYEELIARSVDAGFKQYEIANFAKDIPRNRPTHISPTGGEGQDEAAIDVPSLACKHNVNYWQGGDYHGLGPSATGYVRGVRTKNWANTQLYCEQLEKGRRAIESSEELSPLRRAGEIAAFGLRMNAGWRFANFQRATDFDLRQEWSAEMKQLEERGWGNLERGGFRLTRAGLRFADAAAEMFLR
ncbi:MAG: radical SAM family heme chaperone HemW [Verrucomicrobiota bacterium]